MDVVWDEYKRSYLYRLRVALYYLQRRSDSLKRRSIRAGKRSLFRTGTMVAVVLLVLYGVHAPLEAYGFALVLVGAAIIGWTGFRVHEKAFLQAALLTEDMAYEDTEPQRRVSSTSLNYFDALAGFVLVCLGYIIQLVTVA